MAALIELSGFGLMAGRTFGGCWHAQDKCAFMFNRTRIACFDLMAALTGDIGGGHRAAAVLLDDARCGVLVAGDTPIAGVKGNGLRLLRLGADALSDGGDDECQRRDGNDHQNAKDNEAR